MRRTSFSTRLFGSTGRRWHVARHRRLDSGAYASFWEVGVWRRALSRTPSSPCNWCLYSDNVWVREITPKDLHLTAPLTQYDQSFTKFATSHLIVPIIPRTKGVVLPAKSWYVDSCLAYRSGIFTSCIFHLFRPIFFSAVVFNFNCANCMHARYTLHCGTKKTVPFYFCNNFVKKRVTVK